ncbi:MAG: hypothetical protein ACR2KA_10235 [Opitutales bacterium]
MKAFLARRPLLIGVLLLGLAALAIGWFFADAPSARPTQARKAKPAVSGRASAARAVGAPRGTQGLRIDDQHDISADGRPPNARREGIIRTGLGEIQEMQQMHKAVFDDAAKRWNAQPRVKELVAKWKEVEEAWKTQDDEAKAAVVPQMEAMWKEALGLLREEIEKSAREAEAGVK